ncbi:MAG TPA: hypothetical protein VGF74_19360 [Thermoleophilaceae bacterium]
MVFVFVIGFGLIGLAVFRMYGGHEEGGEEPGDDGPPRRRGRGPRPRGPRSPEPSWWPEFEREFRIYASRSSRKVSGVGS